jgi:hypothetical protein
VSGTVTDPAQAEYDRWARTCARVMLKEGLGPADLDRFTADEEVGEHFAAIRAEMRTILEQDGAR